MLSDQDINDDTPPPATDDGVIITPFVNVASVLPRNPLDELTTELNRVVKAIRESEANKPVGEITLTIKVQRASIIGAVDISAEVKAKLPKEPKMGALLFVDDDGNLSTRNPNQRDMFERPRSA
jgi:hypothetical protein